MKVSFLESQWQECCERLQKCASHIAVDNDEYRNRFCDEASAFAEQSPPKSYPILLDRFREAASLAVKWQDLRENAKQKTKSAV